MRLALGVLLLVIGVAFPMAAMAWLNRRMTTSPALTAKQIGLALALNGTLPVSLIFFGLGMVMPRLWAVLAVRLIAVFGGLAALVLVAALRRAAAEGRAQGPHRGDISGRS